MGKAQGADACLEILQEHTAFGPFAHALNVQLVAFEGRAGAPVHLQTSAHPRLSFCKYDHKLSPDTCADI